MSLCGVHLLSEKDPQIKFGDLVIIDQPYEYRNDGVSIYDGEKIIDLETDYDGYGALPSKFRVLEAPHHFPLNYWHSRSDKKRRIAHNRIVWYDYKKNIDEILSSLKPLGEKCFVSNFKAPDGKTYRFVYEFYNDYEEMVNPWIPDKEAVSNSLNGILMRPTHPKTPEITPESVEKMKEHYKKRLEDEELYPLSLIPFTFDEDDENTLYFSF